MCTIRDRYQPVFSFHTVQICMFCVRIPEGLLLSVPSHLLFPSSVLYQISHLGDNDDEPEFSSAMPLEEGETFFFAPRSLKNLVLADEIDSLSPIMDCKVCTYASCWLRTVHRPTDSHTYIYYMYVCMHEHGITCIP